MNMDKSSSISKTTSRIIPPKELEIKNQNQLNNLSTQKSKCSISRCICIQFLIILGLLVLAAIIIPICVIIFDGNTQTNVCAKTYSDTFTTNVIATTQCTSWRAFTTSLTCTSYSKMRIYGSNDPTGITITDSAAVTALAIALRYNTSLIARVNGINWRVGPEWNGYEITTTGGHTCSSGYTVRPCSNNIHWGGINGPTCSPTSQTLSLYFE